MKLLLDENLPVKLKFRFADHGFEASTIKDMQWLGKQNGELLKLMLQHNFTTLITIDNNISSQQNFKNYSIQVIVLVAADNTYGTIMEFFDLIIEKVQTDFTGPQSVIHPSYIL